MTSLVDRVLEYLYAKGADFLLYMSMVIFKVSCHFPEFQQGNNSRKNIQQIIKISH